MLDCFANQASGLIGLGCQPSPRLVAMVSHGDERAELPLLWQLCLSLVNFGYSVTVLDGTTAESDTNPGMEQLLENLLWEDDSLRDRTAWTVLPSAKGIQTLLNAPHPLERSLHHFGVMLPAESIVVLYCKADCMEALIGDRHTAALLAVSQTKASLLTGYIALKRLLIKGKLRPTIVNMLREPSLPGPTHYLTASEGLSECAKKFLGQELKTLTIAERQADVAPCDAVQRLALRLLESAVPLDAAVQPANWRNQTTGQTAQLTGSH